MKEITVRLANQSDDPDIRHLLATNPVPGQVTITYEREPDYFLGCGTMGHFYQIVVGRHQPRPVTPDHGRDDGRDRLLHAAGAGDRE